MAVLAAAVLMAGASVAAALNAQAGVPPTPAGWTSIFADDFTGNA